MSSFAKAGNDLARLEIFVNVAVRDVDGYLYRIAFDVKAVGILKQLDT